MDQIFAWVFISLPNFQKFIFLIVNTESIPVAPSPEKFSADALGVKLHSRHWINAKWSCTYKPVNSRTLYTKLNAGATRENLPRLADQEQQVQRIKEWTKI